jgi:hypothetical protein
MIVASKRSEFSLGERFDFDEPIAGTFIDARISLSFRNGYRADGQPPSAHGQLSSSVPCRRLTIPRVLTDNRVPGSYRRCSFLGAYSCARLISRLSPALPRAWILAIRSIVPRRTDCGSGT